MSAGPVGPSGWGGCPVARASVNKLSPQRSGREGHMKLGMVGLGLALMILVGSSVQAKIEKVSSESSHKMRVTTFCIEGHLFVVAISDVGEGGGTAITQVYHDEQGRNVPMQCVDKATRRARARNKR